MHRFVILAVLAAAIAVSAGAEAPVASGPADQQDPAIPGDDREEIGNGTVEICTEPLLAAGGPRARPDSAPRAPPVKTKRTTKALRPSSDVTAPPWGRGQGVGPVKPVIAVPTADATTAPEVTPVLPGLRLGQRRYLVGPVPIAPPFGNTSARGRTIAASRSRSAIGTGTATGLTPPAFRFVRWSPAGRWRAGVK